MPVRLPGPVPQIPAAVLIDSREFTVAPLEFLLAGVVCLFAAGVIAALRRGRPATKPGRKRSYALWLLAGSGVGLLVLGAILTALENRPLE